MNIHGYKQKLIRARDMIKNKEKIMIKNKNKTMILKKHIKKIKDGMETNKNKIRELKK